MKGGVLFIPLSALRMIFWGAGDSSLLLLVLSEEHSFGMLNDALYCRSTR